MAIRVLCVNDDSGHSGDRPTLEMITGLHREGIEITVVCMPDHPHYPVLKSKGIPIFEMRFRRNIDRAGARRIRQELVRGKYQIVHTFNNKAISNVIRAARDLPVSIVAYRGIVGAVGFLDPVSWMRYLNPRIDRIVCVAEAIRQHFLSMKPGFLRMPPERPVTIHKGHRLEWYEDEPADLAAFDIPDAAFTIACVANYRPRKGIEVLIDAVEGLPGDIPAHLLLIGHMDAVRSRVARSSAKERIHILGYQDSAPTIVAACDVFCLPSIKREGLARALIEAMAYRVAPVVSDSGGSPELVVDGECGIVVPARDSKALAEAIERLYRDPALRRRYGEAARERIGRHFRSEDTVRKTIELYRELVAAQR